MPKPNFPFVKLAKIPFREEDLWNGPVESTNISPYALAKRFMEAQSQFYNEQYDIPLIHLILTNIYGSDHAPIKLIRETNSKGNCIIVEGV